jgi:hypothetical protein
MSKKRGKHNPKIGLLGPAHHSRVSKSTAVATPTARGNRGPCSAQPVKAKGLHKVSTDGARHTRKDETAPVAQSKSPKRSAQASHGHAIRRTGKHCHGQRESTGKTLPVKGGRIDPSTGKRHGTLFSAVPTRVATLTRVASGAIAREIHNPPKGVPRQGKAVRANHAEDQLWRRTVTTTEEKETAEGSPRDSVALHALSQNVFGRNNACDSCRQTGRLMNQKDQKGCPLSIEKGDALLRRGGSVEKHEAAKAPRRRNGVGKGAAALVCFSCRHHALDAFCCFADAEDDTHACGEFCHALWSMLGRFLTSIGLFASVLESLGCSSDDGDPGNACGPSCHL